MSIQTEATPPAAAAASVEELCDHLANTYPGDDLDLLCDFARIFYGRAPRELREERSLTDLAGMIRGAFRFLGEAQPDRVHVQAINPQEEGWQAPVTVIRAELGDRPFIVDTIREYLSAENIAIHHYIYPVLCVERDDRGVPTAVGEEAHGKREALIHCEIGRLADPARRQAIAAEIERRLCDVVAVTSDFVEMLEAADHVVEQVEAYAERFPARADEFREINEFLRWLKDENFVFFGFRSYSITGAEGKRVVRVDPGSGLGILRDESRSTFASGVPLDSLPEALRRRVVAGPPLIISKANAESTVHRRARIDYIGVKRWSENGRVVGEWRFLGLFTSKAYTEHAEAIPILRSKLDAILRASGSPPGSHDYKETITIFNSMPKEELFQASPEELGREVQTVLSLLFTDEVRVTLRPDPLGRGVSVTVILPRGRFSGEVRHRVQEAITERLGGAVLNYHLAMGAGDQARLHFYLSATPEALADLKAREVERIVVQLIRSWEDRLLDALEDGFDAEEAQWLASVYGPALSDEYRAANLPAVAVHDIQQMEKLRREDEDVAVDLWEPRGRGRAEAFHGVTILKLYLRNERLVLSDFMPILDHAGLRVVEVTPFAIAGAGLPQFMIYSFAVQDPETKPIPVEKATILTDALLAARRGDAPDDMFNALVLRAGLHWREVDVLRTYANYAFQIGAVPARYSPARALIRYPGIARLLVELFRAKFDPDGLAGADRAAGEETVRRLRSAFGDALDEVSTLTDDRAFRRLISLINATTRTNYFRHGGARPTGRSGGAPYISIKIRCADVEELKKSRLLYEVYVHSSRMEGIHLRGAAVSRGGIRWSDRPDDFRTEILGLVQTQVVKNAVIVPGGSKGGFITKRTFADRDATMHEAAEQYRTLIRGMLDITDNLVDGQIAPPPRVIRYDGDDPYLVVAADKGTAHLSDVANAVAAEYGFWLGDAFASGGSYGYDHKKEGITARGAWECVKRHFREMGKDIQNEPFTVAGIGDMSGDVFGNGMLLSRQIRLVGAFDHRHIFIDPDPDPAVSYAERERLFALPRSSWDDYDQSRLSAGGMIVPRSSKAITITPGTRAALGLDEAVERLDGEALIRAVLRAPVELLWNGGIGTYVKENDETHAEVGDPSNDPVRVDARELRCGVVGEGGNLGFTQPARVAYALRGGRINTDALDNSAGVDMSDHEVNLKILLNPLVAAEQLGFEARNELLEELTDEVAELVLQNNVSQSLAVSLDEQRSRENLTDFAALIAAFERDKLIERGVDGIPTSDTIQERAAEGAGLTRPTLCVLLAFSKLQTRSELLASSVPDDRATLAFLERYFPEKVFDAVGSECARSHRLRREIIVTELTNSLVDLMGASFLHRLVRDSGAATPEVVWAWLIASRVAGAREIRRDLAQLEGMYPAEIVYRWYLGLARVLERTTLWALANVAPEASTSAAIEEHRAGLGHLRQEFGVLVSGEDREIFRQRVGELRQLGADQTLAERLITLRFLPQLLNILRISQEAKADAVETARVFYGVSERFAVGRVRHLVRAAAGADPWDKRYAQVLTEELDRVHRTLTRRVIACADGRGSTDACLEDLVRARGREALAYRELLEELEATEHVPLSGHALAVRALAGLAAT